MNYEETLNYLYAQLPMFQNIGSAAYKNSLENINTIDSLFSHPHRKYRTIHVAGTNGKGSVSHTLAAILQVSGYKVGLYTSPHLKDFRERIRVNGEMITTDAVVDFVSRYIEKRPATLSPSFFEITVGMAFDYFALQQVDVAVVEVGLGGRLDSTNIITPDISIITNISFDHTNLLGNTLERIATEKAGIIKPHIPVVIGEATNETKAVFVRKAMMEDAPILFAEDICTAKLIDNNSFEVNYLEDSKSEIINYELGGFYQTKNLATIMTAVLQLKKCGFSINKETTMRGCANVCSATGLQGRWQCLAKKPLTICDTGHNEAGIAYVVKQLKATPHNKLIMVIGMVKDKDIEKVLALLPTDAVYIFTQAGVKRALDADLLKEKALKHGLTGKAVTPVKKAFDEAQALAGDNDLVFVGGSNFVVAEVL